MLSFTFAEVTREESPTIELSLCYGLFFPPAMFYCCSHIGSLASIKTKPQMKELPFDYMMRRKQA
jgi:hypothetical protein